MIFSSAFKRTFSNGRENESEEKYQQEEICPDDRSGWRRSGIHHCQT